MKKLFKLHLIFKTKLSMIVLAESEEEALKIAKDADVNLAKEVGTDYYVDNESIYELNNSCNIKSELNSDIVYDVSNNEKTLHISVDNQDDQKNFPFLCSMYDAGDPEHTIGDSEYFIEQINEAIQECEDNEYLLKLINQLAIVNDYSRIIVS